MLDTAVLAQRLADAESALHDLRLGRAAVVIKVDGREVHYRSSTIESLQAYVEQLRACVAGPTLRRGKAIGVIFN